jgi:hypothetical protein
MTGSGEVSHVQDQVRSWAKEHPILHSISGRESILSRATEVEIREAFSMSEVVGNLAVTLDDVSRRLDLYADQLLDEARWQAELFVMDQAVGVQVEGLRSSAESAVQSIVELEATVEELAPQIEAALEVAETAPEVIGRERAVALEAAREEISRAIQFAHEERIEAILEVKRSVAEERVILTADLEDIAMRAVERASLRAAQWAGIILVAAFVAAIVLLYVARRMFRPNPGRITE